MSNTRSQADEFAGEEPTALLEPVIEPAALVRRRAGFVVLMWIGFVVALLSFKGSPVDGFILCPFRFVTGWSCPGCGMTRACTAALHGHWADSLGFHPMGIGFVLSFFGLALVRGVEFVRGRRIQWSARLRRAGLVVSVALLVFVCLFGGIRLALEIAGILTPV